MIIVITGVITIIAMVVIHVIVTVFQLDINYVILAYLLTWRIGDLLKNEYD